MDVVERAIGVLSQAEASLRSLVGKAAASGDYENVMLIASWAGTVNSLVGSAPSHRSKSGTEENSARQQKVRKTPEVVASAKRHARAAKVPQEYPRFLAQGDRLVRVSWSRRKRTEYQHKAPHSILQTVASAMAKLGKEGRIFSTDSLLPLMDPVDGVEVPDYQVYVAIALLKHAGLLDQHGRRGYSIPNHTGFMDAVESVWRSLPKQ